MRNAARFAMLGVMALVGGAGCAFSSFQTAKPLPAGGTSITAAASQYGYHEGDNSADEEAIELMGSHGLTPDFELGGKIAWFGTDDVDVFNLLVAPKYAIMPGVLALTAPTGAVLVSGDELDAENSWLTMPGVVFSHPFNANVELDLAGKAVIGFPDDFSDNAFAVAANVGVRLTPPGMTWSFMPELGLLWDDDSVSGSDDTGYVIQIGFGFTYEFLPAAPASAAVPPAT